MAPQLVDKVYLPDLEPCLKGETVILSWRLVASALADTTGHRQGSQAIVDFLTNSTVQAFFTKPGTVFESAGNNDPHKQNFESRISAVQATRAIDDKYDFKTIKEDSQWLSKNARINLVAALRIVAIELQSRARSHLTGPISSQDVANLQEAAGATNAQASTILPGLNIAATRDAAELQADFETEGARRRRIFQTYLAERRYFAMTTDHLFTLMLHKQLPSCASNDATRRIRGSLMEAYGLTSKTGNTEAPAKTYHALIAQYFTITSDSIKSCEDIVSVVEDELLYDDDMQNEWMKTFLSEAIHAMTVSFQLIDLCDQVLVSSALLRQWFQFVGETSFLDALGGIDALAQLIPPVQCLVCVISLALLNLPRTLGYFYGEQEIDNSLEYLGSSDALLMVHEVLTSVVDRGVTSALPVALAWVPVLHGMFSSYQQRAEQRDAIQNQKAIESYDSGTAMIPGAGRRNSAGSIITIDKTGYDDFLAMTSMERDIQPALLIGAAATSDGLVYDVISDMARCLGSSESAIFAASVGSRMRLLLIALLKFTHSFIGYKAEPLTALLSLLSGGDNYWQLTKPSNILAKDDTVSRTLNDDFTFDHFLLQALQRFPYEFAPFANLCRSLASTTHSDTNHDAILKVLRQTPHLTFELPKGFNDYELAQEDEGLNTIRFVEDFPLFEVTSRRKRVSSDEESFVIPEGTYGRFMSDSGRIVLMNYNHSTLSLLGKRLEANLSPSVYRSELGILSDEEVADIISLFATLIRAETTKALRNASENPSEPGLGIIAEASSALRRTKDIISVVCDVLDVYLENDPESAMLSIVTACLQFLDALLPFQPGRVWSYIGRCSLLNNESRGGRLSRLTGTLELSFEQHEFLVTTIRLFRALVDSSMSSSVQRRTPAKLNTRHQVNENVWLGVSDKLISSVTVAIAQACIDTLESSSTWRFSSETQRTVLIRDLVPILNNLILYTYSIGEVANKKDLMAPLEPAAKYIIDSFLAPSAGSLRIQPLLATLALAVHWPGTTVYANGLKALSDRTIAVLELATTLVRVANLSEQSSATIETQLFKASPFVARVCAAHEGFRGATISLLEALVVSAGQVPGEPPSLLGYLGPQTSVFFLRLLSSLDKPFDQEEEVSIIWRFLSTIIRNRQQWMANCLLTGKTPRDVRNRHDQKSHFNSDSVLSTALTRLSSIGSIPSAEALSILDFITSAQNYWPWTIFSLQEHTGFLPGLRNYVKELKSSNITTKTSTLQACDEARLAGYIAETFAMQLFHLRQMGQANSLAKDLAQDLDYFLRDGVLVSGFNDSLHENFAKNFGNKYPNCGLNDFKRTLLRPRALGNEYYYALNFANTMLQFDPGWEGVRGAGFKSEMEKANANLSLVDAQIALYHAWEFLLLELSHCLPTNDVLKKQILQVAEQCLEVNETTQEQHKQIFRRLTESRVNLALLLVQRIVDNAPSATDVAQLLNALWATVSAFDAPYSSKNISLYRTFLKLLYVTLRAQVKASDPTLTKSVAQKRAVSDSTSTISQTVLGILDGVVARGLRTLVPLIHDSETYVFPEDVAILNGIMQACLCVPGVSQNQTQIVNIMAAHDAVHVAVSLYSWADELADKGDPIYGELSVLFLLELSALPLVAEQLACDGLLNHLTSANLANYMNRPNVSPFADSVGPQRCYSIWVKGIVPLLLNLLTALGQTIAPEVAYVLTQFPNLMTSSIERFEAPGASRTQTARNKSAYITLLSVSEIHDIALITRVLGAIRANNARDIPEVEWDAAGALENVEFWLGSRKILRERLVPLGQREIEWKGTKPTAASNTRGYESKLEEKIVEQLEGVRTILGEELE